MSNKINLLPKLNDVEWRVYNNAVITSSSETEINITLANGDSRVSLRLYDNTHIKGVPFAIGFSEYTSSSPSRIRHKSEKLDQTSEYFLITENSGITMTAREYLGNVPAEINEYTIYIQPDSGAVYPLNITIRDLYFYNETQVTDEILLHRVMKENLPTSVLVGSDHIYFTKDSDYGVVQAFIADNDGNLVPIGSGSSAGKSEYKNQYTQTHIDNRIVDIRSLQNSDSFSFLHVTDIHIRTAEDEARLNQLRDVVMVSKQIPIDYIAVTGDITSNPEDVDYDYIKTESRMRTIRRTLDDAECPVFYTRGNHDYNSDSSTWNNPLIDKDLILTNRDWHNWVNSCMLNREKGITYDETHPMSAYFFVDDPILKTRLIFLNDFEFSEDENCQPLTDVNGGADFSIGGIYHAHQVNWLVNVALDMTNKEGYNVSFYSHRVPYALLNGTDTEFHGYGSNNLPLRQVIQAFRNGTSVNVQYNSRVGSIVKDFSTQGSTHVVGWFSGHVHDDAYVKENDLNMFVSTNTCASQRTSWSMDPTPIKLPPPRNETNMAMSLNLFIINKRTKVVNVVKLGSGIDRSFSY